MTEPMNKVFQIRPFSLMCHNTRVLSWGHGTTSITFFRSLGFLAVVFSLTFSYSEKEQNVTKGLS